MLGVPFVQPALSSDRERVRGFLLLVFHADPSVTVSRDGGEAIRTDVVARFVRRYFGEAEGARAPYDPELGGLLEQIKSYEAVPLLPIGEYARVPSLEPHRL
jgi:hypothetical protein